MQHNEVKYQTVAECCLICLDANSHLNSWKVENTAGSYSKHSVSLSRQQEPPTGRELFSNMLCLLHLMCSWARVN